MILAIKQVSGPSSLGDGEKVIQNRYQDKDYERYGKAYPTFLSDLYQDRPNR